VLDERILLWCYKVTGPWAGMARKFGRTLWAGMARKMARSAVPRPKAEPVGLRGTACRVGSTSFGSCVARACAVPSRAGPLAIYTFMSIFERLNR
jgi:hypothetical protein